MNKIEEYNFLAILGSLFVVISILHFIRIISKWPMMFGSFEIRIWWSYYILLASGFFAFASFRLLNKKK